MTKFISSTSGWQFTLARTIHWLKPTTSQLFTHCLTHFVNQYHWLLYFLFSLQNLRNFLCFCTYKDNILAIQQWIKRIITQNSQKTHNATDNGNISTFNTSLCNIIRDYTWYRITKYTEYGVVEFELRERYKFHKMH